MKFETKQYANSKEILKHATHHVGVSIMVSDAGVTADSTGRKLVPAGTLVGSSDGAVYAAVNGELTKGVLLSDADVTHGSTPGTMVIHGFIDSAKLPAAPSGEAIAALPMIMFL